MNTAAEYALSIAQGLSMLDEIHYDWWKNDVATTVDRIREVGGDDDHLVALANFLENEYAGETDDIGTAYLELALDVWTDIQWRWNQQDIKSVTALVTSGGPHATVKYGGYETDVLVEVTWGSEVATRWVACAPVANVMSVIWDNAEEALR